MEDGPDYITRELVLQAWATKKVLEAREAFGGNPLYSRFQLAAMSGASISAKVVIQDLISLITAH